MKKLLTLLSVFVLTLMLLTSTSCTQNQRAKSWGGTAKLDVPKGQKLLNVTWKGNNIWILSRKMEADETPEVYEFHEESSFGMAEGVYILTEHANGEDDWRSE